MTGSWDGALITKDSLKVSVRPVDRRGVHVHPGPLVSNFTFDVGLRFPLSHLSCRPLVSSTILVFMMLTLAFKFKFGSVYYSTSFYRKSVNIIRNRSVCMQISQRNILSSPVISIFHSLCWYKVRLSITQEISFSSCFCHWLNVSARLTCRSCYKLIPIGLLSAVSSRAYTYSVCLCVYIIYVKVNQLSTLQMILTILLPIKFRQFYATYELFK